MGRLSHLREKLAPRQKTRDSFIDPAAKPASGKIRTLTIRHLAEQCGLGGHRWLDQFATGFPIAGAPSQNGAYAPDVPKNTAIDPGTLPHTDATRFRERARMAGIKKAPPQLWGESTAQVKKGWLNSPVELEEGGRPKGFRTGKYNIAFRFGAEQAAKLRACDDLRRSLANSACSVLTPIQLASWGHLAQLCRRSCGESRDWALLNADHEAAYKQLPTRPSEQAREIIASKRPVTGKWLGFASIALVFGATAALLRYNVFSRLIAALVNRLLGIPLICFFDDFAALAPRLLANKAMSGFPAFASPSASA